MVVGRIATQRMNLIQGDTGRNYFRENALSGIDFKVSKKVSIIVNLNITLKLNMRFSIK